MTFVYLPFQIFLCCSLAAADCQISAGEYGYDSENNSDFVKSETVRKRLVVLVDCSSDAAPHEIKIKFNLGGRQCRVFDWRYTSQFGYIGTFPTGLKGLVSYSVETQDGVQVGASTFKVATAKKVQAGCQRGAASCRKKLTSLTRKEKKAACGELVLNLKGPIFLDP